MKISQSSLSRAIASSVIAVSVALIPLAAFAQTTVGAGLAGNATVSTQPASVNADVTTQVSGNSSANGTDGAQTMSNAQSSFSSTVNVKNRSGADKEIDARVTTLNELSTRVGVMKNLSESQKSSIQSTLNGEASTLTTLRAKIDADATSADVKTDAQSITKNYRIYILVVPQVYVNAASDRVSTIVGIMQGLSAKLQTRISAAQSTGKDESAAQSAYTDMQAKILDASTQASTASSETANLEPDQGNTSLQASNRASLKDAAAKIKVANADLKAARADISTIIKAVHGVGVSASATTTISAQ
jgi:hypothetical protein